MKFIAFNIVVAAALIYLVADRQDRFAAVPSLDTVSATAERLLERPPSPPAPPADETSATAPAVPDPTDEAPAQPADTAPAAPPVPPAETASTGDPPPPAAEPPAPPLDPVVARRRAEILGTDTDGDPQAAPRPATSRRQRLLDLAEEMELLAAESIGR